MRERSTMAAGLLDSGAVQEVLTLLSTVWAVTAVTLYRQFPDGAAHITVRKTAQQQGRRAEHRYGWEARTTAGERAWEWTSAQVYTTAEAAYQAAVKAVQAAADGITLEQAAG